MLLVNILIVVGVAIRFSGSGGASQALVLALRETLAAAMKVGGQVGKNSVFVGIGDIGDSRRMANNKDNNIV